MNYYGLYHRVNYDGSKSESIIPLAVNIQLNEGEDISFEPDTSVTIKVTAHLIVHIFRDNVFFLNML